MGFGGCDTMSGPVGVFGFFDKNNTKMEFMIFRRGIKLQKLLTEQRVLYKNIRS